jgi:hypothetical protein
MYSDIYSKLTPEEREILDNYHKKVNASRKVLGERKTGEKRSPARSKPAQNSARAKSPHAPSVAQSSRTNHRSAVLKKTASSSTLSKSLQKKQIEYVGDYCPNLKYEIEKLLRGVYRHSVICSEFKEELRAIGGIPLVDEYVQYRSLNPN